MTIRTFLVDDHPIVRSGLRSLIEAETDMVVVGEAADGAAAIDGVAETKPDVVVLDVSMPRLSGGAATERIRAANPDVRVLALTVHEEREFVRILIDAGASGYVLKKAAAEVLVHAIRAVSGGGVYLDPAIAHHVVGVEQRGELRRTELSEREAQVLRLIAEGHPAKDIAARLHVSARTLETYRKRATLKLGIETRAEIIRYALMRGWLRAG